MHLLREILINPHFIVLSIISALFAAISNIYVKRIVQNIEVKDILAINFMTICIVLTLFSPFFFKFKVNYLSISLLFTIGLIDTIGN